LQPPGENFPADFLQKLAKGRPEINLQLRVFHRKRVPMACPLISARDWRSPPQRFPKRLDKGGIERESGAAARNKCGPDGERMNRTVQFPIIARSVPQRICEAIRSRLGAAAANRNFPQGRTP
jgi:hypothetical protein